MRVTKQNLDARVAWINDALGLGEYESGSIVLDHSNGGVRVERVCDGGGRTDISPRGTKREALAYLDMLLSGIRIAQGFRK